MSPETTTPRTQLARALGLPAPIVSEALNVLEDLLGDAWRLPETGLDDQIIWWRWRNVIRLAHRTAEVVAELRVPMRPVPAGHLLPLVAAASEAADREVRELWARLLCGAVHDTRHHHPIFVRTLASMSGNDARAFRDWCVEFAEGAIDVELDVDPGLQRLQALALLERPPGSMPLASDGRVYHSLRLSLIGRQLRDALLIRS